MNTKYYRYQLIPELEERGEVEAAKAISAARCRRQRPADRAVEVDGAGRDAEVVGAGAVVRRGVEHRDGVPIGFADGMDG